MTAEQGDQLSRYVRRTTALLTACALPNVLIAPPDGDPPGAGLGGYRVYLNPIS